MEFSSAISAVAAAQALLALAACLLGFAHVSERAIEHAEVAAPAGDESLRRASYLS
jgi:hypothetical protein